MQSSDLTEAGADAARRPSFFRLAVAFARYGNFTFGGGSATVATLRSEILVRRRWITEDQFHLAFGLSRLTPGTNVLAFCAATGAMIRGFAGALIAVAAGSLPCSMLAVLVTHFYGVLQHSPIFGAALSGALAAAVAVMVNTSWILAQPHVRASLVKALVIVPSSIVMVTVLSVSAFRVLLLAAAVGALWPAKEEQKAKAE